MNQTVVNFSYTVSILHSWNFWPGRSQCISGETKYVMYIISVNEWHSNLNFSALFQAMNAHLHTNTNVLCHLSRLEFTLLQIPKINLFLLMLFSRKSLLLFNLHIHCTCQPTGFCMVFIVVCVVHIQFALQFLALFCFERHFFLSFC